MMKTKNSLLPAGKLRRKAETSIWKWLKGSRILYFSGIGAIAVSTLVMMGRPLIVTFILDTLLGGEPSSLPDWIVRILSFNPFAGLSGLSGSLLWSALLFLLMTTVGGYFMYLKGIWTAEAAETTALELRERLYRKLQYSSYEYHVKAETGDIMQRCTSDVETVRMFLANQLTEIGRAVSILSITAVIMVSLDPGMMLVSVALLPVIFLFSFHFFKRVRKKFKEADEAEGAFSNVVQENLTGIRVVRAFARQEFEKEKFEARNSAYRDRVYELLRILASYWAISDWFSLLQITLVVVVGGYSAVTGNLTLGIYIAFIAYIERILWPIRQMGRILTDMGKMFVARDRIGEILVGQDELEEIHGQNSLPAGCGRMNGRRAPSSDSTHESGLKTGEASPRVAGGPAGHGRLSGRVEFRDVKFAYVPDQPVLQGVSFTVEPGETIAVLGPTGSGKSTLIHLLARLYEPDEGEILIDGIPICQFGKRELRSQVGIVLQEPFLFNRSIGSNIALAVAGAAEEKIRESAEIAAVHDVIMKFERGYDTEVGEGGVTLSGGQKQRIAIARMLIRNPPILVFDDSLSAVDTITDEAIRKALRRQAAQATTFIISHRITTLSQADRILVLERGSITASGTHEELIARDGLYRRIWNIQSLAEDEIEPAAGGALSGQADLRREEAGQSAAVLSVGTNASRQTFGSEAEFGERSAASAVSSEELPSEEAKPTRKEAAVSAVEGGSV